MWVYAWTPLSLPIAALMETSLMSLIYGQRHALNTYFAVCSPFVKQYKGLPLTSVGVFQQHKRNEAEEACCQIFFFAWVLSGDINQIMASNDVLIKMITVNSFHRSPTVGQNVCHDRNKLPVSAQWSQSCPPFVSDQILISQQRKTMRHPWASFSVR